MATVRIVAGDLKVGDWDIAGGSHNPTMSKGWFGESISLRDNTESVEELGEDDVRSMAKSAGWGAVGGIALGPLGLVGGALLGGKKKQVAFACHLSDGRKFMATTDTKTWRNIQAGTF